jgi:hypothetical protein
VRPLPIPISPQPLQKANGKMLTYQVRPRVFRITGDRKPEFPAEVEVSLYLQPLQPFGMAAGGGLTAVRGSLVNILEFIPIKSSVAMVSNARESYATHSRLP